MKLHNHSETLIKYSLLKPAEYNPRIMPKDRLKKLVAGIKKFGIVEPIVVNKDYTVIGGHQRLNAVSSMIDSGDIESNPEIPCIVLDLSKQEEKALNLALNKISGDWDFDKLSEILTELQEFDELPLELSGFDEIEIGSLTDMSEIDATSLIDTGSLFGDHSTGPSEAHSEAEKSDESDPVTADAYDPALADKGALVRKYIAPPFSILDARQGYWRDRKAYWSDIVGIDTVEGKEELRSTVDMPEYAARGERFGGSAFDPVLAEVTFTWFSPPGGKILDPFGGESTKGIVAGACNYDYLGIELRKEQVDANNAQFTACEPKIARTHFVPHWICGDSAQIDKLVPAGEWADLIFTSPPYYDLEIYSKSEKDGSAFETYEKFMDWYKEIFRQCVSHLKPNRFLVVKIGELRDSCGFYHNFVGDNISCFLDLDLKYYNEAILVTPVGSLPIRAPRPFNQSRKLGKAHQNILVFYKGDSVEDISRDFKPLAGPEV